MGTVQILVEYYLLTRLFTESLEHHIGDLKKNPNQNTPSVKNVAAKNLKKAMLKKCEIKMGGQGLLLLQLIELKLLIMVTRPQNITVVCHSNVLRPDHHYQKFYFHQQQEALAAYFDFTPFSAWPFRFLSATILHQGCFGWNFISFMLLLPLFSFLAL